MTNTFDDGPFKYDVNLDWRGEMAAHILWIARRDRHGNRTILSPNWITLGRHGQLPDDFERLVVEPHDNLLQQIVDAAWAAGVRPTAAQDTESVIKAKDDNLRDLRNLIFNQDTTIKGVGRGT